MSKLFDRLIVSTMAVNVAVAVAYAFAVCIGAA